MSNIFNYNIENNVHIVLDMDFPLPGMNFAGYTVTRNVPESTAAALRESGMPAEGIMLGADNFTRRLVHTIPHGEYERVAMNNLKEMIDGGVAKLVKRDCEGEVAAFSFCMPAIVFAEMAGVQVRMHVRTHVANGEAAIACGLRGKRLNAASIFMERHQAGAYIRVKDAVVMALSDGDNWEVVRVCRRNDKYIIQDIAEGEINDRKSKAGMFADVTLAAIKSANGVLDRFCNYRSNPVDQKAGQKADRKENRNRRANA